MIPTKINIAIAKECGWKPNGLGPEGTLHDPQGCTCFDGRGCSIPNYHNSLDAMREAEKMLTRKQLSDYVEEIDSMINEPTYSTGESVLAATSQQRAEAFCRVKGIWNE